MKTLFIFTILIGHLAWGASSQDTKGLLQEIQLSDESEEKNQKKAFQSEVLIIQSETKAIETLKSIIKKKKNTPEEVDYLFRLAELDMRRSKSGRFFDLNQTHLIKLKVLGLEQESSRKNLKQAVSVYEDIARRFPRFIELDTVYFNLALAYAQQNQLEIAHQRYSYLINNFPNSHLVPDALLEAGEINYQRQKFKQALSQFKDIEKYPNSKAYPYGLYKSAWAHYNLKESELAIQQLLTVLKINPIGISDKSKYNLRQESLRDLTLFVGEITAPEQIINFFSKITSEDELGLIILNTAQLYESYSRHKEISIFAEEFIKRYKQNDKTPEIYSKLIQTQETLKNRPLVIKKLTEMAELCLSYENLTTCQPEFKKISLEITQKWWEIWLKNKTHTEFSSLTEKAFEVLLSTDSPMSPDSKSRYAYADLQFQLGKWSDAQKQYEIVSEHEKAETKLKHDALYGALFSIEKIRLNSDSNSWAEKQKKLAIRYLNEFKEGEHRSTLIFKLATIAYQQTDYDLALQYLQQLSLHTQPEEQKMKAEDMRLDIYNIKKDYVTLVAELEKLNKNKQNPARGQQINELLRQAEFAFIQSKITGPGTQENMNLLVAYAEKYKNTELALKAHWQALSMAYTAQFDFIGAQLSEKFFQYYPQDQRSFDALQEAVKVYTNSAHLPNAIRILEILALQDKKNSHQYNQNRCELFYLNSDVAQSKKCFINLFKNASIGEKNKLVQSYLNTFKKLNPDDAQDKVLQQEILKHGLEPYSTEALIQQAQNLLLQKNETAAFQMSLRINARQVDESVRAGARLIQAQILENEFKNQSIKTREDKLSLVLAMKAEKLDKSLTAYTSALKMSKTAPTQIQALNGIGRLYSHFIEAIENISLAATLSEADQKAIKAELRNIVSPFREKLQNNQIQLARLRPEESNSVASSIQQVAVDKTVEPLMPTSISESLNNYLITEENGEFTKHNPNTKKCTVKLISLGTMANCVASGNFTEAEELGLKLAETTSLRSYALYNLAVVATFKKQYERAFWLLERSLKLKPNFNLAHYLRAKLQIPEIGLKAYFKNYDKIFDTKFNIEEKSILSGLKAFSERDFQGALKELSGLSSKQIYTNGVDIIYIETLLQTNQIENAKNVLASAHQLNAQRLDLKFQEARLYEIFLMNPKQAVKVYQEALGRTDDSRIKNWLLKKIEYLTDNKTQLTSYVGGQ